MLLKGLLTSVMALIAIVLMAVFYGDYHWKVDTQELRARLDMARLPVHTSVVDFSELDALPAPVQHYLRTALTDGQPIISGARLQHSGNFNMAETTDRWQPFSSEQKVVTQRPGFDWDARIRLMPGVSVRVHDAYIAGEGFLHASLLGLFSLVKLRGNGEIAHGELMRYFAEAVWYPTALLPSQGVHWQSVNDHSARGTISDGAMSLTLLFTFNAQGLIDSVRAEARGRAIDGKITPTPWLGRFWNYTERENMRIPLDGEVAWQLPAGPKPYWRGHIEMIEYELPR